VAVVAGLVRRGALSTLLLVRGSGWPAAEEGDETLREAIASGAAHSRLWSHCCAATSLAIFFELYGLYRAEAVPRRRIEEDD
jgi:hypothetical protein